MILWHYIVLYILVLISIPFTMGDVVQCYLYLGISGAIAFFMRRDGDKPGELDAEETVNSVERVIVPLIRMIKRVLEDEKLIPIEGEQTLKLE